MSPESPHTVPPSEPDRLRGSTVRDAFRAVVEAHGRRPFLAFGDAVLTYAQTAKRARALAAGLHDLGVDPGDRLAVALPNWPEFVISALAAAELGAVVVPLDPGLTANELQFTLRNSEATAVVTPERHGGVDHLERAESFLQNLPALQYVVTVGEEELWYDDRIFQFEDLVSSGERKELPSAAAEAEDVWAILYTSGTTGKPKGVMLTHANVLGTAVATAAALRVTPEDVVLCTVPLFHIFGLGPVFLMAMVAGARIVLQEAFDAGEALALAETHGVTVMHGTPTMFEMELRHPERPGRRLERLRTGIVAAAPVSPELIRRVRAELVPDAEIAYGLTETSPTVTITGPADLPEPREGTVGRALPGVEVVVLGDDGERVPAGTVGEVAIRGYNVMKGYHRQPEETARAFTPDGFFRTGDLGALDAEGFLRIAGRRKELILRGGFNVHPREVEDVLQSHPAVQHAAVVGVPHEVWGEQVCACLVLEEGAIVTAEEIRQFCRRGLAESKIPDLVRFFEALPRTGSGKIRRAELVRVIAEEESARRAGESAG
jgi:fatty-acyl-CoA synthase